jgi:hypothetical protein
MRNSKIENCVAAAGFAVLAVMLFVEIIAISGTWSAGPGQRQASTMMMTMQFRPR